MVVALVSLQMTMTRFPGYLVCENVVHNLKAGLVLMEERFLRLFMDTVSNEE
jgi:hypothetical protein